MIIWRAAGVIGEFNHDGATGATEGIYHGDTEGTEEGN